MAPRKTIKAAEKKAIADEKRFVKTRGKQQTADSFVNFAARLGVDSQSDNLISQSGYGFNPITRLRIPLEWMYRGSWICRVAIDAVADDMTRAGIEMTTDIAPEERDLLERGIRRTGVWEKINELIKWGRLYGGAIAVPIINGQDLSTPLRIETIGKGQFLGLMVLDRWMVEPTLENLVTTPGPDFGLPKFYKVRLDAPMLPHQTIHHSRAFRYEGISLPYWQRLTENLWSLSVFEPLYDRLVAFDSTTVGAAQLVYKSYIRTYAIKGLREILAAGGKAADGLLAMVQFMRQTQSSESVTLIDGEDKFETHAYTFSGLSDVLLQFAQQLSGSLGIPMVRLFGQSPTGLNSSGDSDLRTYYDNVRQQQDLRLHRIVDVSYRCSAASDGIALSEDWGFNFKTLWQLTETEKADIATKVVDAAVKLMEGGVVTKRSTALAEVKASSRITGFGATITDEDLAEAEEEPPLPTGEELMQMQNSGGEDDPSDPPGSSPGAAPKPNGKASPPEATSKALN